MYYETGYRWGHTHTCRQKYGHGGVIDCCLSWWRHQTETFSALLAICAGNSPVPGEFPAQRPVTRSFDVFFDLHPNKPLSKQWWGWWFETLLRSLWRHRNGTLSHQYAAPQTVLLIIYIPGRTFVFAKEVLHHKNCNIWHCGNDQMMRNCYFHSHPT